MPEYRPNPKTWFGPDPPPPVTEGSRVWLHRIKKNLYLSDTVEQVLVEDPGSYATAFRSPLTPPLRRHIATWSRSPWFDTVKALWYSPLWNVTPTNPSHSDFGRCRAFPRWTATLLGVTKSKLWLPRNILSLNRARNHKHKIELWSPRNWTHAVYVLRLQTAWLSMRSSTAVVHLKSGVLHLPLSRIANLQAREGALNQSDTFVAHSTFLYAVSLTTVSLSQTK